MNVDEIQHMIGVIGLCIATPLSVLAVLAWPVPPVQVERRGPITVGGGRETYFDADGRIRILQPPAASACVWCSAGPREAHTETCPYVP